MVQPNRRRFAIRAAANGAAWRCGMGLMERVARVFPRRFPMVDRRSGRLEAMDVANFGRFESVAEGVGMVHSFANVGLVEGRSHALLIDTSSARFARQIWLAIRAHTSLPIQTIIYTHGHIDHVSGVEQFLQDAAERGDPRPEIWAQERILKRFERYERLPGWIAEINRRQFALKRRARSIPPKYVRPDHVFAETATLDLDGEPIELYHASAETDDACWVWLPQRRVAFVGDLLLHSLPNTGNPNKVQRDTLGWAEALEAVAARQPQHLIPGHLQPVSGPLCHEMLTETARALRYLHDAVLDRLNAGLWPDDILAEHLQLPPDLQAKPYLKEAYGCCEFVVRDVLRQYAGWWGGNPTQLFPLTRCEVGTELVELIGVDRMREQVRRRLDAGDTSRALYLAVALSDSATSSEADRELLASVLDRMAANEPSMIARNLYAQEAAAARADAVGGNGRPVVHSLPQPASTPNPSSASSSNGAGDHPDGPYRSAGMRVVNAVGRGLWACGLKRPLRPDAILQKARRRTGLTTFGDDRFLEGLERLCESFERSAQLNPLGAVLVRERLMQYTINRLKLEDHFARHPVIAEQPMRKPLFVIGLPRTGTTLLYNLLSQDPRCRPLMTWETLYPLPDPLLHGASNDPRRKATRRGMQFIYRIAPQMKHIHPIDPDGPEECTWLLNNTFVSPGFVMDGDIPEYLEWVMTRPVEELVPVYRDYKRQFQLIGWGGPTDRHWITKSPLHLFGIAAMLDVFPDGCFVQTHRDPVNVVPSTCSLVSVMRGKNSDAVDSQRLGPEVARRLAEMLDRSLVARKAAPERVFDVRFDDLVKDPFNTVRRIYDHFGYELSDEMQRRMERWMRDNPQHKHGVHKYSPEQFGLTPQRIRGIFGDYARTVGVAD